MQILEEERFLCIEKIKTTGSTYMAASGLTNETNYADKYHVAAVAEYAFAIRRQLQYVNEHSWNNFRIRIGETNVFRKVYHNITFSNSLEQLVQVPCHRWSRYYMYS